MLLSEARLSTHRRAKQVSQQMIRWRLSWARYAYEIYK